MLFYQNDERLHAEPSRSEPGGGDAASGDVARKQDAVMLFQGLEHGGPDLAQEVRRRAEARWPADVWNVIVEHGQRGFPNWNEDAKEQFHLQTHSGDPPHQLNVILFSRHCFRAWSLEG